jgi:hypothetical protein
MPNQIIKAILDRTPEEEIHRLIEAGATVPLFIPIPELAGRTLFDQLTQFGKVRGWDLHAFIQRGAINPNEKDADDCDLMQHLIAKNTRGDLLLIKLLLYAGVTPTETHLGHAAGKLAGAFLNYRPGRHQPSIYEQATERRTAARLEKLKLMALDFDDTTDEESSEYELSDSDELSAADQREYEERRMRVIQEHNETGRHADSVVLLASRGVHYVPRYFPAETRCNVLENRENPHTTYSSSTLFDSGYTADDEPEEDDERIVATDRRNLAFIEALKGRADKNEKGIAGRSPPRTRNAVEFDSLYFRYMQVFIHSYSRAFNQNSVQIDFDSPTRRNIQISLSYLTVKAGCYAFGVRFEAQQGHKRDPHYRRFDSKPKHPAMGYIDIYDLPVAYARDHGFDRLLMYFAEKIKLKNTYYSEAEVIFFSMLPRLFNVRHHVVVMPRFDQPYQEAMVTQFGITTKTSFTRAKNDFTALPKSGAARKKAYENWVKLRMEHTARAQAARIDRANHARLFRLGKVHAYNHGDQLGLACPKK